MRSSSLNSAAPNLSPRRPHECVFDRSFIQAHPYAHAQLNGWMILVTDGARNPTRCACLPRVTTLRVGKQQSDCLTDLSRSSSSRSRHCDALGGWKCFQHASMSVRSSQSS